MLSLVLMGASRLVAKAGPSASTTPVLVTAAAPWLGPQGHKAVRPATSQLLSHLQHPSAAPCSAEASQGRGKHSELAMRGPAPRQFLSFGSLRDAPACASCRGLGKHPSLFLSILPSLHPSIPLSCHPSNHPSCHPSIFILHSLLPSPQAACTCPGPFPFPHAGAGPASTPQHRLHTPRRMGLALLLSSPSGCLSSTSPRSPMACWLHSPLPSWQVPSFRPFCLGTSNLQALCPGQLCSGFHRHWMEGLWHLLGAVGHLSGALGCLRMTP